MALQASISFQHVISPIKEYCFKGSPSFACTVYQSHEERCKLKISSLRMVCFRLSAPNSPRFPIVNVSFRGRSRLKASKTGEKLKSNDENEEEEESSAGSEEVGPELMDSEERREWRRKIREVVDRSPDYEEVDPVKREKIMQKLSDYPLVVDEEDPDWPEDADGRGFNLDKFFDKITIKNVKKDKDDDNCDSDDEMVWQDDNYIRPIKDITTAEWEETVFKDISPLVILVHNRYKRPQENEKIREELEKAVHIIWNCRLPSPRCVAIDAVVELDLVSALNVSLFPEIIFTKAGKILYREKMIRTADELSKIMAFFYYGAAKPLCLKSIDNGEDAIPCVPFNDMVVK